MRNRYVMAADLAAVMLAAWAAFAFRFGWFFADDRTEFLPFLLCAIIIKLSVFMLFGMYRRYWRYAGFWDLMAVVLANSAASIVLGAVMVGSRLFDLIPELSRSVLPLDWIFALALTAGIRASVRAVAETVSRKTPGDGKTFRRVLIVGAGEAGVMVAREMQRNPHVGLRPVGFVDDDRKKANKEIHGLKVLGSIPQMGSVIQARHVDEVVIAIPTAGGRTVRDVVERCHGLGVPSRVVPGIYELLEGTISVSRLRSVDIADLLRRPQLHDRSGSPAYLNGACVVVTGAGGSIGSELCRQVAHAGPSRLVMIGHGENSIFSIAAELRQRFPDLLVEAMIADVRDRERIHRLLRDAQPTVVFHAAAHKHVPLMEDNASEAVSNNIVGTRNVVDAAIAAGVRQFVMVSTDKAAAPSNMMGASKRVAELLVQRAAKVHQLPYVVVRFGNVLGSRGSVVPTFKAQIERGGPITVTHPEVRRYFMTIPEAVHLILQAGGLGIGGELFVLDMGEPVFLRDLAADMIRLSGLDAAEIPIVYTGLRPGEKLDEILWEDGASVEPTTRGDIRRVREVNPLDMDRLDDIVSRFSDAAARDDHERIAKLFREILPSATVTAKPRIGPPSVATVVRHPSA
jgi:FlaA1/EpsC-like NDP-sugar epimerase